jgi:hypothetical protein
MYTRAAYSQKATFTMLAMFAMFVNNAHINNITIKDNIAMADKQVVSKGFRVSVKADEILKEVSKRDFRDFPTVVRYALLEHVQKQHPDLYESLAAEFTPQ